MAELDFEWDDDKAAVNLAKHGVTFIKAATIFAHEMISKIDDRKEYGEVRYIGLGRVEDKIFRVIYTWRGDNRIRIISAQRANKDEQKTYYQQIFTQ